LFYLEEVENMRLADEAVYLGRAMHEELASDSPKTEDGKPRGHKLFYLDSARFGLKGRVDAIHHRNGSWIPYEHKRGRAKRNVEGKPESWPSDALQVRAYAMLIEEATGKVVSEGRVRYHSDNITVRVPLDDEGRNSVLQHIERARELRRAGVLPPINKNEYACANCSLAPACLPEEERLLKNPQWEPARLFPATTDGEILHVITPTRIGRNGEAIVLKREGEDDKVYPVHNISALVAHGNVQLSTQALHLCSDNNVAVHWFTAGGRHISSLTTGPTSIQRRIAQYHALCNPALCLELGRRLVKAKIEDQLRFILRSTRSNSGRRSSISGFISVMKDALKNAGKAEGIASLRGVEGSAGRAYFAAISDVLLHDASNQLRPIGRSRRPPKDRFNAILSFGYSLLYASVMQAVTGVGLEPALGFFHTPRSNGQPLVLDMMELFRVPVWDMTVVASINRQQWEEPQKFDVIGERVWLSKEGKREAIGLFERRMEEVWKHPVTQYSLSWRRTIELEVRLLEKEWTSSPGLFARARIR
jgi:CRISPR-associated protein Cas1